MGLWLETKGRESRLGIKFRTSVLVEARVGVTSRLTELTKDRTRRKIWVRVQG